MAAPKELSIRTSQRCQLINITEEVQGFLKEAKAQDGSLVLFVPHTTAGVTINENADPDVVRDILHFAEFDGPRSRKLWLKYQPDAS